jgi:uncharacterized membrane protein YphA (DoxX/SURF4 family)
MSEIKNIALEPWKTWEKLLFRFFFIYFLIQSLPLNWHYLKQALSIDWSVLYFGDIFHLTRYSPNFLSEKDTFLNWAIIALIALASMVVWTLVDRKRKEYNLLYYSIRVIVRYRLAIGVIGYGFIKLFPMQAPYPSISNLNSRYGDFSNWKIFSLSLGIVPGYEAFLGLVEIFAGLLLLYRKTATFGAFLVVVFTGNVFVSNLAYEGGEHIYSLYLISFALFLLAFDAVRLYNLFSEEKIVAPNRYRPIYAERWQKVARYAAKGFIVFIFVVFYGFKTSSGFHNAPYQYPSQAGLEGAEGLYDVSEFRINNKIIPYSPTDPIRWKDAVFEKWATFSVRSNRPVKLVHNLTEQITRNDNDRIYELAGSAGRHYYAYKVDKERNELLLENRNKNYAGQKLKLRFKRPAQGRFVLEGVNEQNDSIYVVLNKIPKKYLIIESNGGRGKPIKL